MSVVKIIELVGSSSESSDAAVQAALSDAQQTLRNIKGVDVVSTGLRGDNLDRVASARSSVVPDRPRQRVATRVAAGAPAPAAAGPHRAPTRHLSHSRNARPR